MIRPRRDSNPGPLGQKSNALTTEPKSRLPDAVVRDWLYTEAMQDLLFLQIFKYESIFVTPPQNVV